MKNFLNKLKTVSIGASPIIIIILAVHFFVNPMPDYLFWPFIASVFMLILGQVFLLTGVDRSILMMGELVGSNLRKLKTLPLILIFGLLFGTMATAAEPAVSVLASNVGSVNHAINPLLLTWVVSSGIGIFVAYGLFRVFKQISIKWSFLICYAVVFILIFLTPQEFQAIAFDFSGATTGVITVPFILSLGVGVSAVLGRKGQDDSYGMIGIASVGPIITMCIMGIIFGGGGSGSVDLSTATPDFFATLGSSLGNIVIALLPITVIFFIFNFAFVKLPKKKIGQILFGLLVTIFGLTMFLTAVNFGFSSAGRHIGESFADPARADWFKYLLIPLGVLLGFAITYTEVAIRVLAGQVEQNTNGHIKKGTLIFALALGLAVTVALGIIRILFMVNILWFIIPIFALGLILMPFIPKMFVGIGFDSGGVASGTITAAFLVPLTIGVSETLGGRDPMIYGFGMIAFIAAIPMVAIATLGLIYAHKQRKAGLVPVDHGLERKSAAHNYLIGIVAFEGAEQKITEHLVSMNAKVMTKFNAINAAGPSFSSVFNLTDERKTFLLAMISEARAVQMINILETEFGYENQNTGIAFTIPIDEIVI